MNVEMIVAYLTEMRHRFTQDSKGVTAIEYGLIAALVACVIIASLKVLGKDLNSLFNYIGQQLVSTGA